MNLNFRDYPTMAETMRSLAPGWEVLGCWQSTEGFTATVVIRAELEARITMEEMRLCYHQADLMRRLMIEPPRVPPRRGIPFRRGSGGAVYS